MKLESRTQHSERHEVLMSHDHKPIVPSLPESMNAPSDGNLRRSTPRRRRDVRPHRKSLVTQRARRNVKLADRLGRRYWIADCHQISYDPVDPKLQWWTRLALARVRTPATVARDVFRVVFSLCLAVQPSPGTYYDRARLYSLR